MIASNNTVAMASKSIRSYAPPRVEPALTAAPDPTED
jgi:hypothetical protein